LNVHRAGNVVERPLSARPAPMALARTSDGQPAIDQESMSWIRSLRGDARVREEAIARLHALLLRAARFEAARRRSQLAHLASGELEDIAMQSADDALVAVLAKLDDFRGQSRFTTWAYKFALLETAVKLRRRPWQGRELPLEPERWAQVSDGRSSPTVEAEQGELLGAVRRAIETELTRHQREVLVAVAIRDVPIDVLAERLGTTRGALYKTIHDARRKLRRALEAAGHELDFVASGRDAS
jgi:RNA polymerase sigma-70 factor, ECF subfamily